MPTRAPEAAVPVVAVARGRCDAVQELAALAADSEPTPADRSDCSAFGHAAATAAEGEEPDLVIKGAISLLQEFVQCSKGFRVPPRRPILQWSFDTRMADLATLEFRATVGFLLDGVPHHAAGPWQLSKKAAQRGAAECALAFFVGRWGEHLAAAGPREAVPQGQPWLYGTPSTATGGPSPVGSVSPRGVAGGPDLPALLEGCCRGLQACDDPPPQWSVAWTGGQCQATVELDLLGVPHRFLGGARESEEAARRDVAKRVLWYLQVPGFEELFEPDPRLGEAAVRELPPPPPGWARDQAQRNIAETTERKTAVMRTQNRLQQALGGRLQMGQSVWSWSYEASAQDRGWPPLCRATADVPALGRTFAGNWVRGHREAQVDACAQVSEFLDRGLAGSEP